MSQRKTSKGRKNGPGAFSVGQRVRVVQVCFPHMKHLIGQAGTVMSSLTRYRDCSGVMRYGQHVSLDNFGPLIFIPGISKDESDTIEYWPAPEMLEPIDDYDGRQVTSWDSCCWKPTTAVTQD